MLKLQQERRLQLIPRSVKAILCMQSGETKENKFKDKLSENSFLNGELN